MRSYSLSSAPGAGGYRISVKREPHGAASSYLTSKLRPGAVLDVAAPRGDFVLDDGPEPVLLISAGIGVTPVLAMLHHSRPARSSREVWWLHGARRPQEQALAAEAHALLASLPHAHEHVFYSRATPRTPPAGHGAGRSPRTSWPAGPAGRRGAYICGPDAFMADMQQALTALGLDPARIHTELFGALAVDQPRAGRPGPPATAPAARAARHRPAGHLRPQRLSTPFGTGLASVLELADACDVPTRWSCRTGVCHTCVTPLLAGESPTARTRSNPRRRPGADLLRPARHRFVLDM